MADLSQGYSASLILKPGDVFRIGTSGTATVRPAYGAPAVTTTLTAQTQDFGPYSADAKLEVVAVAGTCTYALQAPRGLTYEEETAVQSLVSGDGSAQQARDGLAAPVQHITTTAAISATATARITPSGVYRTARISWVNNGANAAAKLNIAANCGNDVEGLVASQSPLQRDAQMTMGDALILASPTPITSLNVSSDVAIASDTHRLTVTFGA